LVLLNIPLDRVIALDKTPHVRFSEVWTPSLPCEASSGDTPEWVAHFLRNKFIPPTGQINHHPRIWIDRSTAISRKMPLTKESKSHLKAYGFEIYRLEELPFFKQVVLFSSAKAVAGPHGAGFTGTIFSRDAQIVEFFDKEYVNACYYSLSCHVGGAYY
jgi:capsular polysaccharide biosynthesis protein